MPRPEKKRIVNTPPLFNSFKPTGYARIGLKKIILCLDEYEALMLADYSGMDHAAAAVMMEISRSTFTRLIEKARKKAASFLIEGAELVIEGGNVHFRDNIIRCADCEHMFRTDFNETAGSCPSCGSRDLIDMAGRYGHGNCCRRQKHGHRGGGK